MFFTAKPFRHKGLTVELLKAALKHVAGQGGKIVESYPVIPKKECLPAVFAWTGLISAFHKIGFVEVIRRSETKAIMRYIIKEE